MEIWQTILNALLICIPIAVLLWIASYFFISAVIYTILLVRTSPKKWTRECSLKEDEEQLRIYEDAMSFREKYESRITKVSIENEGFKLFGEFVDFGSNRTVILIPGRMEGCVYPYHFAEPYRRAGYNILSIDSRCHGMSGGKYNSLGLKEYSDIIAWSRMLHDEKGIDEIVIHGICIGSATALYTLTSERCPDYIVGMVADGMYINFWESTKNHMLERNKKPFPYVNIMRWYFRLCTGTDSYKDSPINVIDKLNKPILFLYSRKDTYSMPDKSQLLYDKCKSEKKKIVWFDKGQHSRVRINNRQQYDDAIVEYLRDTFGHKEALAAGVKKEN